jgi:hypothetical protein
MYWIYLIIFVLVVFAPEYVRHGYFFLGEEDAESVLIFCLNILAFLLYLAKERALGRIRGEQKQTQQEKKFISRDLEDSYSYIGELNRKFEILKRSVGALPGTLATFGRSARDDDLYHPILDAVKILSKTDSVALYFAHVGERRISSGKKVCSPKRLRKHFFRKRRVVFGWRMVSTTRLPRKSWITSAVALFSRRKRMTSMIMRYSRFSLPRHCSFSVW